MTPFSEFRPGWSSQPEFPAAILIDWTNKGMKKICEQCGRLFIPHRSASRQKCCGRLKCLRARKRKWQRGKLNTDADYRANQAMAQKRWRLKHRDYWREYRERCPESAERNRGRQRERNHRRRLPGEVIVKMDELGPLPVRAFLRVHVEPMIAKMDELLRKIGSIPGVSALPLVDGP